MKWFCSVSSHADFYWGKWWWAEFPQEGPNPQWLFRWCTVLLPVGKPTRSSHRTLSPCLQLLSSESDSDGLHAEWNYKTAHSFLRRKREIKQGCAEREMFATASPCFYLHLALFLSPWVSLPISLSAHCSHLISLGYMLRCSPARMHLNDNLFKSVNRIIETCIICLKFTLSVKCLKFTNIMQVSQ